jgi:ring-1,2-phenylacetyl-CoA epoxidase subunit PaaC
MTRTPGDPGPDTEAARALCDLLTTLVRSKHFLGFQYASWCVKSPSIEANIALAGMAQEELGHAMVLEGLLSEDLGAAPVSKDTSITWYQWVQGAGNPPALEAVEEWPEVLLTCLALDRAIAAMLSILVSTSFVRLAQRARKMLQEERFHLTFGVETVRELARVEGAGRRLIAQYREACSRADSRLASDDWLRRLVAAGVVTDAAFASHHEFLESIDCQVRDLGR